MTNPNPFSEAPEHEVNREIARRLSLEVIAALRPDELDVTEDVIDDLIDEAARGRVIPKGAEVSFGSPPVDLDALVIVPALVGALTGLLASAGVGSFLLLNGAIDVDKLVSVLRLSELERATGKQYTPDQRGRVKETIRAILTRRVVTASAVDALKRETLEDLLAARSEEYREVAVKARDSIDPSSIVRLRQQMAALEEEMRGYEHDLKALK